MRTVSSGRIDYAIYIVVQCRLLFGLNERQLKAGLNEVEINDSRARFGHCDFGCLGTRRQVVPPVFCEHVHQPLVRALVVVHVAHHAQLEHDDSACTSC